MLQYEIAPLLIRPVGRPPKRPVILYDDFWYRAGSWDRARRVVAKVEWYRGEAYDSCYRHRRHILTGGLSKAATKTKGLQWLIS